MAKALADVVLKCKALEKLFLTGGESSYFKADLLPALAALATNTSLKVLDISDNSAGDDCMHALAISLNSNTSLVKLSFDGNHPSSKGLAMLAAGLTRNKSVYDVKLPERDAANVLKNDVRSAPSVNKAIADMRAARTRNQKTAQAEKRKAELEQRASDASDARERSSQSSSSSSSAKATKAAAPPRSFGSKGASTEGAAADEHETDEDVGDVDALLARASVRFIIPLAFENG